MSISSILDLLNSYQSARHAPGAVSDGDDRGWFGDGASVLDSLLTAPGLRRAWLTSQPREIGRTLLARIVDGGRALLRVVGDRFVAGRSTLAQWFRQMKGVAMPRIYAGAMAMAGTVDLPPVDRRGVRDAAAAQLGLLEGFRDEIESGALAVTPGVAARSALYSSAPWAVAINLLRDSRKRDGHTEEKRLLGSSRPCVDCPPLAAMGWVPIGTLPAIGTTACNGACRCYHMFR